MSDPSSSIAFSKSTYTVDAQFVVFGDFNVHNKEWLTQISLDWPILAEQIHTARKPTTAISHNLSQIVTSPARVPDRDGDTGYRYLHLFLTSAPEFFSHKATSPLGSSDNCVVTVKCEQLFLAPSVPFHRTVYRYAKADWCGFRSFFSQVSEDLIINDDVHKSAQELAEWLQFGMNAYIPHRSYQVKPHSQTWFTPVCSCNLSPLPPA